MSHSLVSLNGTANLLKNLGLKSKEGLTFSLDGECIFLKGKLELISYKEEDVPSSSGRSVKKVKAPQEVIFLPSVDIKTDLMSRVNMCRIFCAPNPELFRLGKLTYPQIIEPLTKDRIFVTMVCNEGVTLEELEKLDHFVRVYVLS